MFRWLIGLLVALSLALGCEADEGSGSFEVAFAWGEGGAPSAQETLFVVARVEDRFDDGEGRTLASAGPEVYRAGLSLAFDKVPLGRDRRVVVELREQAGSAAMVRYYGISEPFDLVAGQKTRVEVRIALVGAPGTDATRAVGLTVPLTVPGLSPTPQVELELTTDTAVAVELSNLADLPSGSTQRVELSAEARVDDQSDAVLSVYRVPWDLDEGLSTPCGTSNFCRRQVFARFVDGEGYRSRIFDAQVVVDSQPPAVAADTVEMQLLPSADNPLSAASLSRYLSSVTTGTRIRIAFSVDEPASAAPTVEASAEGVGPLAFVWVDASDGAFPADGLTFFVFEHVYEGLDPIDEAELEVRVSVLDKALNRTEDKLPLRLVVDTVAPSAPRAPAEDQTGLVYERRPWGDETSAVPSFTLTGASGSVSPASVVRVFAGEDPSVAALLAEAQASDDGSLAPLSLPRANHSAVYVQVIDAAGNATARASLVRDVRWTASFGQGTEGQNPHAFEHRAWWLPTLLPPAGEGEANAPRLRERGEEDGVERTQGAGRWQRMAAAQAPEARFWPATAFDRARGQVVMYGGVAFDGACDGATAAACATVQEWNGHAFVERRIAGAAPAPRDGHAMTWDGARGQTLIFGGKGGAVGSCGTPDSSLCRDLWAYDGDTFRLLADGSAGPSPSGRDGSRLVYDWRRQRAVLFGGLDPDRGEGCVESFCDDTWEWDGTEWRLVVEGGEGTASRPSPRNRYAAAFDEQRGELLLFGGVQNSDIFGDTWAYDGTSWRDLTPPFGSEPQPSARRDGQMVYSKRLGRVVLFGGEAIYRCDSSSDRYCGDLWTWSGTVWEPLDNLAAAMPKPPPRTRATMAEDAFGNLLVFGGYSGQTAGDCDVDTSLGVGCRGVWLWEDGFWRERSGVLSQVLSSRRFGHSMAFDARSGMGYLVGGRAGTPSECIQAQPDVAQLAQFSDVWQWDGSAWTEMLTPGGPASLEGAVLVAQDGGPPLLIGGAEEHYTARRTPTVDACGLNYSRSYDTAAWSLDGGVFTAAGTLLSDQGGTPLGRRDHTAVGLPGGGFAIYGGRRDCQELSDAHVYDGTWQTLDTGASLPARNSAALAYHEALDQLLLFGGSTGDDGQDPSCTSCRCMHGQTLTHDGIRWAEESQTPAPAARGEAAAAYVSNRETVLLSGGAAYLDCGAADYRCSDFWEWDGSRWHPVTPADPEADGDPSARQQHVMVEDKLRGELVLFGGTTLANDGTWLWHPGAEARPAQVVRVDFSTAGAAPGTSLRHLDVHWVAGSDDAAVELQAFHEGRFVDAEAVGFVHVDDHWQSDDDSALSQLAFGAKRTLGFALMPAAANGTRPAYPSLESDLVEVRVDYRLPDPTTEPSP